MSKGSVVTAIALIFLMIDANAQQGSGLVTLEKQEDYTKDYKSRRGTHGALLSVSTEAFYPIDYRSLYNDAYIEQIIGEDKINLVGIEIGYKYNFGPISAAILGQFSQGSVNGNVSGDPRTIKVAKQGFSANIALDGILNEPWVVPYAQVGMHQFSVEESKTTDSASGGTALSFNYRYGLLFQIDWIENRIDKSAKGDQLRSSGLENTFIDVYFANYLASRGAVDPADASNDGDPNLFSSGEMGIGLKMEF